MVLKIVKKFDGTDSSKPPTSWDVISEDNQTDVLIAREMELYRLKQDEHQTTTMVIVPSLLFR